MSRGGVSGEGDEDIRKHEAAKLRVLQKAGPLTVWLVDGMKVRNSIFVDFTEGGNGEAYKWMPDNEVWLDNANYREHRFILLHELHEYNAMQHDGITYDKAHDRANTVELKARHDPSQTERLLAQEIARLQPMKSRRYGS